MLWCGPTLRGLFVREGLGIHASKVKQIAQPAASVKSFPTNPVASGFIPWIPSETLAKWSHIQFSGKYCFSCHTRRSPTVLQQSRNSSDHTTLLFDYHMCTYTPYQSCTRAPQGLEYKYVPALMPFIAAIDWFQARRWLKIARQFTAGKP